MSRLQLDALLAESADGLDAVDRDHLRDELGSLLSLVEDTPPAPSPELAELLGTPALDAAPAVAPGAGRDLAPVVALPRLTGPRGAVTGAVVLAVATVGATGLSAAANSLPAPLQRQVSELSRSYLPFDFPRPRGVLDRSPTLEDQPAPQSRSDAPPAPLSEAPAADRDEGARSRTATRGGTTRTPQQVPARSDARVGLAPRSATVTVRPTPSPSPSASTSGSTRSSHDDAPRPRRGQPGASAAPEDGSTGDTSPRSRGPATASASASPAPSVAAPSQEPDRAPVESDRGKGQKGDKGDKGDKGSRPQKGAGATSGKDPDAGSSPGKGEARDGGDPAPAVDGTQDLAERVVGTVGALGPG